MLPGAAVHQGPQPQGERAPGPASSAGSRRAGVGARAAELGQAAWGGAACASSCADCVKEHKENITRRTVYAMQNYGRGLPVRTVCASELMNISLTSTAYIRLQALLHDVSEYVAGGFML